MPDYRGIQISLISQRELKIHPEFPHPDSSQFTFRSPVLNRLKNEERRLDFEPLVKSDSKADRLLGRQSCVSVYVPSLPGSRFWIQYKITENALVHSEWYFFKLLMNGRHITSWGTNARTKPSGQVMRGLFEPSERWDYRYEGAVHKNVGTESRAFYFANAEEMRSAANDGGLIEVLAFRARGRNRALAHPQDFKSQEHYGIFMPSGGLLDRPQDAKFYDWQLVDAKDSPYAIFKYHYRSWDSLQSLQLIPTDHPRRLLSPLTVLDHSCPSQQSRSSRAMLDRNSNDEQSQSIAWGSPHRINSGVGDEIHDIADPFTSYLFNTPSLTAAFDKSTKGESEKAGRGKSQDDTVWTDNGVSKLEVPLSRFSNSTANHMERSSKTESNQSHNRPLPRLPGPVASSNEFEHSRTSSVASNSVSITPSLIQSLNRDLTSPEPEIGLATAVPIPRRTSVGFTTAIFNYISPPKMTQDIDLRSNFLSPGTEKKINSNPQSATLDSSPLLDATSLPDSSKITLHKPKRLLARRLLHVSKSHLKSPTQSHNTSKGNLGTLPSAELDESTVSPSPSEWMFRIPSPVHQEAVNARCKSMWSPEHEAELEKSRVADYDETWTPTPQSGRSGQKCQHRNMLRKKLT